jgi:hypothetical protein
MLLRSPSAVRGASLAVSRRDPLGARLLIDPGPRDLQQVGFPGRGFAGADEWRSVGHGFLTRRRSHGATPPERQPLERAASSTGSVTSRGREIIGTCEGLTSTVLAPMCRAMMRSLVAPIALSWLATMYHDGIVTRPWRVRAQASG